MAELIFYIFYAIVLFIGILTYNPFKTKKYSSKYKKNTIKTENKGEFNTQEKVFINKVSSKQQKIAEKQKTSERTLLECPNCGAPLKAIYAQCEYCGKRCRFEPITRN